MFLQLLIVLQFLRLTVCNDYQCSSDFPLVTDLSQEDCDLEGKYYEEEQEGCFPGCYSALSNIAIPCDPQRCPPGYKCVGDYCEIDEDSCFKYHANVSSNVYYTALWKPECSANGKWAAKQCKGEATNGRCFCFDALGNRLFGQAWIEDADDMTCACSRRKAELLDEGRWYVSFHCDSMGNYEELQCDSKLCWCVEPKTGAINSTVVPETMMEYLPCYSAAAVGSQYLRQCESKKYAQDYIEYELKIHGNNYANFATLLCDEDGSYGAYRVQSSVAYCTWRDNTNLESYQSQVSASNDINCYCARDAKYFSNIGLTKTQECLASGNYKPEQMANNLYYCIDNDGYIKSGYFEELPSDCASYY